MLHNATSDANKKTSQKYVCEKCNYITYKISNYKQHINTNKHTQLENATKKSSQLSCICGKIYKHHSSYYRHKKMCQYENENENKNEIQKYEPDELKRHNNCSTVDYKEMFMQMLDQNKELQELLIKQQEETNKKYENLILHIKPSSTINNNKTIHNNFNILMFLNEKCKDAMTIQEFAERLIVNIDDLEKKKFDCLSNIILKNLKPLSITERPIHCTNIKKKEWYLNDKENGWEKDDGEKLIKNTEYGINKKYKDEFKKHYPMYSTVESVQDKYIRLIQTTLTDLPENEKSRLLNSLAKNLMLNEDTI
jgi:hypothetical protein